jgi:hypothetical protein
LRLLIDQIEPLPAIVQEMSRPESGQRLVTPVWILRQHRAQARLILLEEGDGDR